ncbi:hypothetical protein FRC19_001577 [Serendipita sp. 401]|nr:hypothetical protein FRC15_001578 [Serendipita sp. 397]KAG8814699.1 hypothetical protein FRC19_001577 [Serendipita sp. 401]KAG8852669.1 hypothetical protein FRC20_001460 [Serendipita sp. 405]KAG9045858.1 hypothetical protein FS842_001076 [Serendipita sp. 407]
MKVNTTIDDSSPLIGYSDGDWSPGARTDAAWVEYYLGTYTMSSKRGAEFTFNFTGTAVWLFGALRDNHGLYNVTLDGTTVTRDGYGAGVGLYQQVLFEARDLTPGPHTITLTNNRNSTLFANRDLDFITWEQDLGTDEDTLLDTTDDDGSANFVYGPTPQAWNPDNQSVYYSGTGHTAVSSTAFVTYTFNGSAVSIFGVVGPSQGPYTVQVDSNPVESYTARSATLFTQQLLYRATGLSDGVHTVRLANAPASLGQALTIDYAVATKVQVPIVTTTSTTSTSSETTSSSTETSSAEPTETSATAAPAGKSISTGAIVAIVVAGFALMAMLSFALMMYRRKKASRKDTDDSEYYHSKPDMAAAFPEPYTYSFGQNPDDQGSGRYIPPSAHMQGGYNPLDSTGSNQPTPLYPPNRGPYDLNRRYSQPQSQPPQQQGYFGQGRQADGASLFSGYAPGAPRPGPPSATTAGIAGVGGGGGGGRGRERVDSLTSSGGLPYDHSEVSATVPYGAYTAASEGSSRRPELGHGSGVEPPLPPIPQQYQRQQLSPNGQSPPLALHTAPPGPPGLIPPRKGQRTSLPLSARPEQLEEFRGVDEEELRRRRMAVEGHEQDFGPLMVGGDNEPHAPLPPNYAQATEAFKK